jgi:hypothetical protein
MGLPLLFSLGGTLSEVDSFFLLKRLPSYGVNKGVA